MPSKGIDARRIYGSCAVMTSHLTTGKLHRRGPLSLCTIGVCVCECDELYVLHWMLANMSVPICVNAGDVHV
jgi:hypothetical protein